MDIHFKITFDAPKGGLRRLGLFVALPIGIIAATGLLASATLSPPPSQWAVPDAAITAQPLAANLNQLDQRVAALEGVASCPLGYTQEDAGVASNFTNEPIVACLNTTTNDQLVKVGTGAAAFWIDRYEASVWTAPTGGTLVTDNTNSAYTGNVPNNGQTASPLYALSLPNVTPSRSMTWFQAVEFCAASGKRLPDGQEWLRAAGGTPNGVNNDGSKNAQCNTASSTSQGVRLTGSALGSTQTASCVSDWGAEDMNGNLWEWTNERYAGLSTSDEGSPSSNWEDPGFSTNLTYNVVSFEYGEQGWVQGIPAAALRGGYWTNGTGAGVFALALSNAPSNWTEAIGFRCVLPSSH